jgi:ATP-dependent exoDNAse (exonuclease V) beta subunit
VASGALLARLESLRLHVLARELPVLLPASADSAAAPLSHYSGVIDLVYRDPQSGALAIADYKTDRVEGEPELAARAALYAEQGRLYREALRSGLELAAPPRFELWFLSADRIVPG